MNLKVEHGIIALLLIAFLYYFFTHQSLLSDLSRVPGKHGFWDDVQRDWSCNGPAEYRPPWCF